MSTKTTARRIGRLPAGSSVGWDDFPCTADSSENEPSTYRIHRLPTKLRTTQHKEVNVSTLTSKQRAHLRSLAHGLKPIVHVGHDGVTDAVVESVDEAFNTRELLKLRVLDAAPEDPRTTADQITARLSGVEVPQTIGRTVVLYRPDPENPEIKLPR
jgi:RNA-binding protein